MTRIAAGTAARAGYYFNPRSWEVHPVAADGERLPGEGTWIAVPTVGALVLSPLLGLAFLMFLPFIGFYLTLQAALRPLARIFHHGARELAATMSPGWRPGEAHLTGKPHEHEAPAEPAPPAGEIEKLAGEIEARREAEREER